MLAAVPVPLENNDDSLRNIEYTPTLGLKGLREGFVGTIAGYRMGFRVIIALSPYAPHL